MAVGGERRGIIASASYEARKLGIYTPMPTARARKVCPRLIIVPGDFEKYERFSRFMFSYAYDFTLTSRSGRVTKAISISGIGDNMPRVRLRRRFAAASGRV